MSWEAISDAPKVGSSILVMADTDREAEALARRYVPRWYQLQVEHYAFDAERHANVPGYQPFHETHKRRMVYCDPDNLGPLIEASMIGSAATVRAKMHALLDVGYSYVILIPSIPSVPAALRQDWLTRFARDVMPHFRGLTDLRSVLPKTLGETMKSTVYLLSLAILSITGTAWAADRTVKVGVLTDMSGVAVDDMGPGSVLAAQMAAEDVGGSVAGMKIEIVFADHLQKSDVGATIVRRWFDQEGVDAVADVPNSSVALAINQIARDNNEVDPSSWTVWRLG